MEMFLFILTNIKLCNDIVGLKNTTAFDLKNLNVLVTNQRHYSLFTNWVIAQIILFIREYYKFEMYKLKFHETFVKPANIFKNYLITMVTIATAWLPLPIHPLKLLVICFISGQARTVNYNMTFHMELETN